MTLVEQVAAAIAEQYAPMHDARAPYAKIAAKNAAAAALKAMDPATVAALSGIHPHQRTRFAECFTAAIDAALTESQEQP